MAAEGPVCGAETSRGGRCRRAAPDGGRCPAHVEAPPGAPDGVESAAALKLWSEVVGTFELMPHEVPLLRQVVRVVDRLEVLAGWVAEHGALDGDGKPVPALVESRQQEIILGRLLTTLRLPEDWTDDASRPQSRGGARGPYGARSLRGVS